MKLTEPCGATGVTPDIVALSLGDTGHCHMTTVTVVLVLGLPKRPKVAVV